MPVVAVDHLGHEIQIGDRVQHSTGKEGVLLQLGAAIDAVSEIALVIDEIYGYTVQDELFDTDILTPPAKLRVKVEHMLHLIGILVFDHAVIRGDDPGVDAKARQGLRQCPDHIGQTACLG